MHRSALEKGDIIEISILSGLIDNTRVSWDLVSNLGLWWQYARCGCYKLAKLLVCIFISANLVHIRRAYSSMNYLLNEFRAKS